MYCQRLCALRWFESAARKSTRSDTTDLLGIVAIFNIGYKPFSGTLVGTVLWAPAAARQQFVAGYTVKKCALRGPAMAAILVPKLNTRENKRFVWLWNRGCQPEFGIKCRLGLIVTCEATIINHSLCFTLKRNMDDAAYWEIAALFETLRSGMQPSHKQELL